MVSNLFLIKCFPPDRNKSGKPVNNGKYAAQGSNILSPEAQMILLSALKLRSMGQIMWPVGGIIPAA